MPFFLSLGGLWGKKIHREPNAEPVVDVVISEEKWSQPEAQLLWLAASGENLPYQQWIPVYYVKPGRGYHPHLFSTYLPASPAPSNADAIYSKDSFPDAFGSAPNLALINIWKLQWKPNGASHIMELQARKTAHRFEVPGGGRWEMMRFGDSLCERFVMHAEGMVTWWQIHFLVLNLN